MKASAARIASAPAPSSHHDTPPPPPADAAADLVADAGGRVTSGGRLVPAVVIAATSFESAVAGSGVRPTSACASLRAEPVLMALQLPSPPIARALGT